VTGSLGSDIGPRGRDVAVGGSGLPGRRAPRSSGDARGSFSGKQGPTSSRGPRYRRRKRIEFSDITPHCPKRGENPRRHAFARSPRARHRQEHGEGAPCTSRESRSGSVLENEALRARRGFSAEAGRGEKTWTVVTGALAPRAAVFRKNDAAACATTTEPRNPVLDRARCGRAGGRASGIRQQGNDVFSSASTWAGGARHKAKSAIRAWGAPNNPRARRTGGRSCSAARASGGPAGSAAAASTSRNGTLSQSKTAPLRDRDHEIDGLGLGRGG